MVNLQATRLTVAIALGLLLADAFPVRAQTKQAKPVTVARGWPLERDGMIRLHNYNGSVTVEGWDRDSVHIAATIHGSVPLFGGGSRRAIKTGLETGDANTSIPADLVVWLPRQAKLSVRGAMTVIEVRAFAGTIDASSLSGRIAISGSPAEVTAETMDGSVTVSASPSFLRARTATGALTWSGQSDDVTLSTVGGEIVVNRAVVRRARIETVTGAIRFDGTVQSSGMVSLESHSGDVSVTLDRATSAVVSAASPAVFFGRPGSPPTPAGKDASTRPVSATFSGGTGKGAASQELAQVSVRSFKGRVTVTQR